MKTSDLSEPDTENPPFLDTWPNVYGLVVGFLVLTILFFIFISNYFQ